MKYPKRSQYKYAKCPYRIRNWPEYEAGLRIYAIFAIETALTIRMVLHLPLRLTEGFLRSLADMLEVEIPIPDHTTLSRRLKTLGEIPFRAVASN